LDGAHQISCPLFFVIKKMPKTRQEDSAPPVEETAVPMDEEAKMAEVEESGVPDGASMDAATGKSDSPKKEKEPTKIVPAVPLAEPEPDPNVPSARDVCFGWETHHGTMLLQDLIRMHFFLWRKQREDSKSTSQDLPKGEKDVEKLASRLTKLLREGKKYELSGLKDVPRPFLKGKGRFFESGEGGTEWTRLDEDAAKSQVAQAIIAQFKKLSEETINANVKEAVDIIFGNLKRKEDEEPHSAPRPCDVLFLPTEYPWEENMAYEHQSGNKHMLLLASQQVSGDTRDSVERVEVALNLLSSKVEVSNGADVVQKDPRFIIQLVQEDAQNSWDEMSLEDLAEFVVIFVFEVYLEKQIHHISSNTSMSAHMASLAADAAMPSDAPIEAPTTHDVLFGRG
jgi:hypothetical protein